MSLSKKIFGIVVMLLAIAVVILFLGAYGIVRLNAEIASLTRDASRAINLTMMDKQMVGREVAIFKLLSTTDEKLMETIISGEMAAQDSAMEDELKRYAGNFPENATREQLERPRKIREMWRSLDNISTEAAELMRLNSNVRADRIATELIPFWKGFDKEILELALVLEGNPDPKVEQYSLDAMGVRSRILEFRLALLKYNLNTDSTKIKRLKTR